MMEERTEEDFNVEEMNTLTKRQKEGQLHDKIKRKQNIGKGKLINRARIINILDILEIRHTNFQSFYCSQFIF